jgi:CheY-like chemotaxis protein
MSHEIRTPLNGLLGFSEIIEDALLECDGKEKFSKILRYLEIVKTCGKNLNELIDDILVLSSIESGKFEMLLVKFPPERLIRESVEIFNFKSEKRNIKLDFQSENLPCGVIGAKRQFKQIMFNLIGNAIKFTEEGSVDVKADYKDEFLLIEVKDTGIGIPGNMKNEVLKPFTQVNQSSTRKYGGTGLGLAIVSKILETVGGALNIKSKIGKGTTVSFTFPVKVDADVLPDEPVKKQDFKITANILIVEDDNVSALYLKEILQTLNVRCKIAESFVEMQKICNEGFLPDIALLDISLPGADGFECRKWLIDKFPEKNITYIAETAYVLKADIKRCQDAGFDGFLSKPYSKEELLAIITKR